MEKSSHSENSFEERKELEQIQYKYLFNLYMKKLVLFLVCILCTIYNHVHAYDCVVDGIYYNRISATEVEVTNTSTNTNGDYSGVIVIPETISYLGYTLNVTAIGNEAFKKSSNLTSVQLPESITSIGSYAFYD